MLNIDLHCHSHISDGVLPPAGVVARAAANGVDVFALTDHDDVAGLGEAQAAADDAGITFIPGVEISVTWSGQTVHIVGLRIDPLNPLLSAGLGDIRVGRTARAQRMADDLDKAGIAGAFEGARAYAANKQIIGRVTPGNPGYVEHEWTTLVNAVSWIRASGGMAVLAHPGRYAFNARQLHILLDTFRALGGEGIEVVTGSHHPSEYGKFADLARAFGFKASCGADFHAPGEGIDIGRLPALPHYCKPVWLDWPEIEQLQAKN